MAPPSPQDGEWHETCICDTGTHCQQSGIDQLPGWEGGKAMCLDCGCGELDDDHGDNRHITMDSIRSAAEASEISVDEAMKNMRAGLDQAQSQSQSVRTGSGAAAPD